VQRIEKGFCFQNITHHAPPIYIYIYKHVDCRQVHCARGRVQCQQTTKGNVRIFPVYSKYVRLDFTVTTLYLYAYLTDWCVHNDDGVRLCSNRDSRVARNGEVKLLFFLFRIRAVCFVFEIPIAKTIL